MIKSFSGIYTLRDSLFSFFMLHLFNKYLLEYSDHSGCGEVPVKIQNMTKVYFFFMELLSSYEYPSKKIRYTQVNVGKCLLLCLYIKGYVYTYWYAYVKYGCKYPYWNIYLRRTENSINTLRQYMVNYMKSMKEWIDPKVLWYTLKKERERKKLLMIITNITFTEL